MQLWQGRFTKAVDSRVNDFNSSIRFDARMARQDITGSMAHAAMLTGQGIIPEADGAAIQAGLEGILADLKSDELQDALAAYGASMQHSLDSSAMGKLPARKIAAASSN